jgi:chloride channel 3/4/5
VAGVVDIGSGWTASLRAGVCRDAFWLNREQCCWDSNATYHDDYKNVLCEKVPKKKTHIIKHKFLLLKHNFIIKWFKWQTLFGFSDEDPFLEYVASFFVHVFFSLAFASSAALLVKFFAPYACGSGVPEV